MFKKSVYVIILMASISNMVGCSYISRSEFNSMREQIAFDNEHTIDTIEDKVMKFVYKVYSPKSQKDIVEGLDLLKEISTESEYKSMVQQVGQYNPEIEMEISNVTVKYSSGEQNTDHMRHIYVEFVVYNGTVEREVLIEFIVNPNNKIINHYIWQNSRVR